MEESVSHSVIATGFCLASQAIRTRVHFFPFAGAIAGPYSIACTFTLFGKGSERRSVTVDGGRLGQPDGIRLEDAFQAMRGEVSGIFGLQVSLACQNQRAQMQSSQLAIEVLSPQFGVVYGVPFLPCASAESEGPVPQPLTAEEVAGIGSGAALQDSFAATSVVVVNPSREVIRPDLFRIVGGKRVALHLGTVAPDSAVEIPLDESIFRDATPTECGWGLLRAEPVYRAAHRDEATPMEYRAAYFLVYRDPVTKKPVSVSAL